MKIGLVARIMLLSGLVVIPALAGAEYAMLLALCGWAAVIGLLLSITTSLVMLWQRHFLPTGHAILATMLGARRLTGMLACEVAYLHCCFVVLKWQAVPWRSLLTTPFVVLGILALGVWSLVWLLSWPSLGRRVPVLRRQSFALVYPSALLVFFHLWYGPGLPATIGLVLACALILVIWLRLMTTMLNSAEHS